MYTQFFILIFFILKSVQGKKFYIDVNGACTNSCDGTFNRPITSLFTAMKLTIDEDMEFIFMKPTDSTKNHYFYMTLNPYPDEFDIDESAKISLKHKAIIRPLFCNDNDVTLKVSNVEIYGFNAFKGLSFIIFREGSNIEIENLIIKDSFFPSGFMRVVYYYYDPTSTPNAKITMKFDSIRVENYKPYSTVNYLIEVVQPILLFVGLSPPLDVTVKSLVLQNNAVGSGLEVFKMDSGTLNIDGFTLDSNNFQKLAIDDKHDAKGVILQGIAATIKNFEVKNNHFMHASNAFYFRLSQVVIEKLTLENNNFDREKDQTGVFLNVAAYSRVEISDFTCISNTFRSYILIKSVGNIQITRAKFSKNTFATSEISPLNLIYSDGQQGAVTIVDMEFNNNKLQADSHQVQLFWVGDQSKLNITNSVLYSNEQEKYGEDVVFVYSPFYEGSITLTNMTIKDHKFNLEKSGTYFIKSTLDVTISELNVINNEFQTSSEATFEVIQFYGLKTTQTMTKLNFTGNKALTSGIKFISFPVKVTVTITNSNFNKNTLQKSSQILYAGVNSHLTISNTNFNENTLSTDSASSLEFPILIQLQNVFRSTFSKVTFTKNSLSASCRIMQVKCFTVEMDNLSILQNTFKDSSIAMFIDDSDVKIKIGTIQTNTVKNDSILIKTISSSLALEDDWKIIGTVISDKGLLIQSSGSVVKMESTKMVNNIKKLTKAIPTNEATQADIYEFMFFFSLDSAITISKSSIQTTSNLIMLLTSSLILDTLTLKDFQSNTDNNVIVKQQAGSLSVKDVSIVGYESLKQGFTERLFDCTDGVTDLTNVSFENIRSPSGFLIRSKNSDLTADNITVNNVVFHSNSIFKIECVQNKICNIKSLKVKEANNVFKASNGNSVKLESSTIQTSTIANSTDYQLLFREMQLVEILNSSFDFKTNLSEQQIALLGQELQQSAFYFDNIRRTLTITSIEVSNSVSLTGTFLCKGKQESRIEYFYGSEGSN